MEDCQHVETVDLLPNGRYKLCVNCERIVNTETNILLSEEKELI